MKTKINKRFECKKKEYRYIESIVWGCDECKKNIITPVNRETAKLIRTVLKIQMI